MVISEFLSDAFGEKGRGRGGACCPPLSFDSEKMT